MRARAYTAQPGENPQNPQTVFSPCDFDFRNKTRETREPLYSHSSSLQSRPTGRLSPENTGDLLRESVPDRKSVV